MTSIPPRPRTPTGQKLAGWFIEDGAMRRDGYSKTRVQMIVDIEAEAAAIPAQDSRPLDPKAAAQAGDSLDVERLDAELARLEREATRLTAVTEAASANFHTGREYAFREVRRLLARLAEKPHD